MVVSQCFSKHSPQACSVGITRDLVANAKSQALPKIQNQKQKQKKKKKWGESPAMCVLTGPSDDADICYSLRTTGSDKTNKQLMLTELLLCARGHAKNSTGD